MYQSHTTQANLNQDHTCSPSVRKLHARRFPHSARGKHQVGRCARTRLPLNAGLVCIAIAWVFAFAAIFACPAESISDDLWTPYGLTLFAVMFMSFGSGYMLRDDICRDEEKYRDEERGEL